MTHPVKAYRKYVCHSSSSVGSGWDDAVPQPIYSSTLGRIEPQGIRDRIDILRSDRCCYCNAELRIDVNDNSRGEATGNGQQIGGAWWVTFDEITTKVCEQCGWWCRHDHLRRQTNFEDEYMHEAEVHEAALELFEIDDKRVPLEALRLHLLKYPSDASLTDSCVFERLVGSIYRDFYDCEVRHLGGAGDQGIDLVAVISDQPTILQVKRTGGGALKGGPEIVRALLGASLLKGVTRAELVTSATRFTDATVAVGKLASTLAHYRVDIHLRSLQDLLAMLYDANSAPAFLKRLTRNVKGSSQDRWW